MRLEALTRLIIKQAKNYGINIDKKFNHDTGGGTQIAEPRDYPAELLAEYDVLVDKKLWRTITPGELTRLQEVRDQINALDGKRSRPDVWDVQAQKLREEIAQLRAEVEALPDVH